MRTRPLYRILLSVIFLCLLAMLVVAMVPMALQYQALTRMQATLGKVDMFTLYYQTLEELDEAVGYFMDNEEIDTLTSVEELMEELRYMSRNMAKALHHPLFIDNQYLTESYLERVSGILKLDEEASREERISAYLDYRRVHSYLLDNEWILSSIRMRLVEEESSQQFSIWRIQFLVLFFIVLVFCSLLVLATLRILRHILKPINDLTSTMRTYRPGEGNVISMEAAGGIEETQVLASVFSDMVRQLEEKLETDKTNYELKMMLSETRLQLVESAISPHFLFNCLATISGLAYFEKAPRTRELSMQTAGYLRACLRLVGKEITLKEELEHTRSYIEIQKARFQERIEFVIENDCLSDALKVPAMIIQPLAENAISHGLKDKLSGGIMSICVATGIDSVTISVRDNGKGAGKAELERLRASIKQPFEPGQEHIGLSSVSSRIKGRGDLTIDSSPGEYFESRLVLSLKDCISPQA